jgi:hypothetical protein
MQAPEYAATSGLPFIPVTAPATQSVEGQPPPAPAPSLHDSGTRGPSVQVHPQAQAQALMHRSGPPSVPAPRPAPRPAPAGTLSQANDVGFVLPPVHALAAPAPSQPDEPSWATSFAVSQYQAPRADEHFGLSVAEQDSIASVISPQEWADRGIRERLEHFYAEMKLSQTVAGQRNPDAIVEQILRVRPLTRALPARHALDAPRYQTPAPLVSGASARVEGVRRKSDLDPSNNALRLREHPCDGLIEMPDASLYCTLCADPVGNHKRVCDDHCATKKHVDNAIAKNEQAARLRRLIDYFLKINHGDHSYRGQSYYSAFQMARRVLACELFLIHAIPFNKLADEIGRFKHCLQAVYGDLSVSHLPQLIPICKTMETSIVREELARHEGHIAIFFDGATRVGHLVCAVARFVNKKTCKIMQRLLACPFLKDSPNHQGLAGLLVDTLAGTYGIGIQKAVAYIHDAAQVNIKAIEKIQEVWKGAVDSCCVAHGAARAGVKLDEALPVAAKFIKKWSNLMTTSSHAATSWAQPQYAGRKSERLSLTRWGAAYDVACHLVEFFDAVTAFIAADPKSNSLRKRLSKLLSDEPSGVLGLTKKQLLWLQLLLYQEVGHPLYRFIYAHEGDNLVSPYVYEHMSEILEFADTVATRRSLDRCPRTLAAITQIIGGDIARRDGLVQYLCALIVPMNCRLRKTFITETAKCGGVMKIYEHLVVLRPLKVKQLSDDQVRAHAAKLADLVPWLCTAKRTKEQLVQQLVHELPLYREHIRRKPPPADNADDLYDWWQALPESDLPTWRDIYEVGVLLQPTSAAAERIFSILRCSFTSQQLAVHSDYVQATLMLRYNELQRLKESGVGRATKKKKKRKRAGEGDALAGVPGADNDDAEEDGLEAYEAPTIFQAALHQAEEAELAGAWEVEENNDADTTAHDAYHAEDSDDSDTD